jgi:hypothetical protein
VVKAARAGDVCVDLSLVGRRQANSARKASNLAPIWHGASVVKVWDGFPALLIAQVKVKVKLSKWWSAS